MDNRDYILSFTAASVLRAESVRLACLHAELKDWDAVRERAVADNLLQARKTASAVRVCRELVFRLQGGRMLKKLISHVPQKWVDLACAFSSRTSCQRLQAPITPGTP